MVLDDNSYGTNTLVSGDEITMSEPSRPVSILFAEVCGNALLHEKLGSAEALRAADRCLKRMERAAEVFSGRVVKTSSEELMAVFDSADEALQAGLEMQQRIADLPRVSGVKTEIRVAFSHGLVSENLSGLAGETVNVAAHLVGLAKPGQVLTSEAGLTALTAQWKASTRDLGAVQAQGAWPGGKIVEIIPPAAIPPVVPVSTMVDQTVACVRLSLHYGGQTFILDERMPLLTLGRDADNQLVIRDRRASRHHARIERRGETLVFVDKSTNGTFMTLGGKPELFVRRGECVLYGKGTISFSASAKSPGADLAEFEPI